VYEICLPGSSELILVAFGRETIGCADLVEINVRVVTLDRRDQVGEGNGFSPSAGLEKLLIASSSEGYTAK